MNEQHPTPTRSIELSEKAAAQAQAGIVPLSRAQMRKLSGGKTYCIKGRIIYIGVGDGICGCAQLANGEYVCGGTVLRVQ